MSTEYSDKKQRKLNIYLALNVMSQTVSTTMKNATAMLKK